MRATVRKIAADLIAAKTVDAVLGLAEDEAGVAPRVFESREALEALVLEPKWPLAKTAAQVLARSPAGFRLALVGRGCDERALVEMAKRNRVDAGRIRLIGVACHPDQAERCLCREPWPSQIDAGEKATPADPAAAPLSRHFLQADAPQRLERWRQAFSRCIKCYGCRNACPACQCSACRLEDGLWTEPGRIAPDMFSFHLLRVLHVADACVACGACQDACPVDIPLMLLQLSLRQHLKSRYHYLPGTEAGRCSPLLVDFAAEPSAGLTLPAWTEVPGGDHGC